MIDATIRTGIHGVFEGLRGHEQLIGVVVVIMIIIAVGTGIWRNKRMGG